MKTEIHPTYFPEAKVVCACGEKWVTGSTVEEIHVDICSNCHPFYTGEQRIVDTEGQVDRFYKRLEARQKYVEDIDAKAAEQISPDRPIGELEVGKRTVSALAKVNIANVGQFMVKLAEGDEVVLKLDGIGVKSLADLKKSLRRLGYILPEDEEVAA
jgi:large subunit ribosomal protein L31